MTFVSNSAMLCIAKRNSRLWGGGNNSKEKQKKTQLKSNQGIQNQKNQSELSIVDRALDDDERVIQVLTTRKE